MNNSGRGNFVLMFLILIGMIVLVMATHVSPWNNADDVNYTTVEDIIYYHNLSANITGFDNDITFAIDMINKNITWANSSGTYNVSDNDVSEWIAIYNYSFGNLTINATNDNQTGFFIIPIQATNASAPSAVTTYFEFIINATNDNPNFTLSSDYNVSILSTENKTKNISLVGSDEEEQYPLEYNVSFFDCSFASWSSRNNSDCNLTYSMISESNTTSTLALTNLTYNDVGVYNLTICTKDNINGSSLPLYRDVNYDTNKSYCQNTTLTLLSSLSIDVSNCSGQTLTEDTQFNCTINVTTEGTSDGLNISTSAFFKNDASTPDNSSWFYSDATSNATNFVLQIPINVTPRKEEVGNWTINFSVDDGVNPVVVTPITLYVNWTEENVSLNSISNFTGANAVYENKSFTVSAYDNDLLILDDSVRNEQLTYASNTSWVNVTSPTSPHDANYTTSTVLINFDNISSAGDLNYSVKINVTDVYGNSANQIFTIEILNDTAPNWTTSLTYPVSLNLTEDTAFSYNVNANVSDIDTGDTITFYYENVSAEFCSLNSSTFNSTSGVISFTPVDCDVGDHNVTIIASDGKLNSSKQFNFTIENVVDVPSVYYLYNATNYDITNGSTYNATEDIQEVFTLAVNDNDFLIPSNQSNSGFYNESLIINVSATNSTGSIVDLFNFSFSKFWGGGSFVDYNTTFTPTGTQADNYTVFINISDANGNFTNITFYLNISAKNDAPVLTTIANQSFTINDVFSLDINATDEEDGNDTSGNLTYSLNFTYGNDFATGNPPIFNTTSGIFNLTLNSTYAGEYRINVTVNDSGVPNKTDYQLFYLYVYGNSTLVSPAVNGVFNLTENTTSVLNFTINHSVGNNLTYEFWVDSISCGYQNNSNCNYSSLMLRELTSSFGNGSVFNWSFTPNFTDETYGNYKNLTVSVYPNVTTLNSSQRLSITNNFSFKLNISHVNAPIVKVSFPLIGDSQANNDQDISYDLNNYFSDVDSSDSYYLQDINLSIVGNVSSSNIDANGDRIPTNISYNNWTLVFSTGYTTAEFSELVNITVSDINSSDNSTITSEVSNNFLLTFTKPTTTTTTVPSSGGGGGGSTKLKYFSLRIIVPQDVIISSEGYIEIPFGLHNNGAIDLSGINLGSSVLYNNEFSSDIKVSFENTYIPILKIGEIKNYTMRFSADTDKSGRYKATILVNVTSPKFSDWGDFFIDLRRVNETDAENTLIFIEKLIADNPECLELTELFRRAEDAFFSGDYVTSLKLSEEVSNACEDAILANEQIRYNVEGFVQNNFYYISFTTLAIFFIGFIFYVYKRVRFNKSKVDEYV